MGCLMGTWPWRLTGSQMTTNESRRAAGVQRERDPLGMINGEGIITGTVVSAAAIAAAAGHLAETRLILAILGTALIYWLAHVHAVILAVLRILGVEIQTAAWIAVITCTVLLTVYSFFAGRRGGLSLVGSVVSACIGALLGIMVIGLKAGLH